MLQRLHEASSVDETEVWEELASAFDAIHEVSVHDPVEEQMEEEELPPDANETLLEIKRLLRSGEI